MDVLDLFVSCVGSEILVEKLSESKLSDTELLESVKFSFNVESLGLTLYSNDPAQVCMELTDSVYSYNPFIKKVSVIAVSLSLFLSLSLALCS